MPARPCTPTLQLDVLGVPRVSVDGREARLPLQRAVALLAYLAFNSGPLPRGHLAAMLWPEVGEPRARTRLRRLVYTIEQALGAKVVTAGGDALALAPGALEVDALRFAQFARSAIATATLD